MAMSFNEAFYLENNPDVAAAIEAGVIPSAQFHFDNFGWQEGRNPNPFFDVSHYLSENPDVDEAGVNPLEHFLTFGASEGRKPSADFVSRDEFDAETYLANNPDLEEAGITSPDELYAHFATFGFAEERPGIQTNDGETITEGRVVTDDADDPDVLDPDDLDDDDDGDTPAPDGVLPEPTTFNVSVAADGSLIFTGNATGPISASIIDNTIFFSRENVPASNSLDKSEFFKEESLSSLNLGTTFKFFGGIKDADFSKTKADLDFSRAELDASILLPIPLAEGQSLIMPENVIVRVDNGGSITFHTEIQNAIDTAESNQMIVVGPGVYEETLNVPNNLNGLSLLGANAGVPAGLNGAPRGPESEILGIRTGGGQSNWPDGLTISGFQIETDGARAMVFRVQGDLVIENNIIDQGEGGTNNLYAIGFVAHPKGTNVLNLDFSDNTLLNSRNGLYLDYINTTSNISGNLFMNIGSDPEFNIGNAIFLRSATHTIESNGFINNGRGININQENATISGNIFQDTKEAAIRIQDDLDLSTISIINNISTNNGATIQNMSTKGDQIFAQNMTIDGNFLASLIVGGEGDDIINGTINNDTFFGGGGDDIFVFTGGTIGDDVILDFSNGNNKIDLSSYGGIVTAHVVGIFP